ncbi:metallophosphoesterase family protein [Cohnella abietis]|uniref:Transcriptional regulator n=1 Tax=Cohnella abietis TaxID=2507935 RepID=A0A3T1D739_9BACL|nr:metallophosphoesterase [Cohnella abietis]BBI33875.1 transcriptional regulator [Cohnella abietis]
MLKIVVMGDLHYSQSLADPSLKEYQEDFLKRYLDHVFQVPADMHVSVGDLTHSGSPAEFGRIYQIANERHIHFYQAIGNHDALTIPKELISTVIQRPLYYHVSTEDAIVAFIDTAREQCPDDSSGAISDEQLDWLQELILSSESKPVILFAHHPLFGTTTFSEMEHLSIRNDRLTNILASKQGIGLYCNGHNHIHSTHQSSPWVYIQTAACLIKPSYRVITVQDSDVFIETHFLNDDLLTQYGQGLGEELLYFADQIQPPVRHIDLELRFITTNC